MTFRLRTVDVTADGRKIVRDRDVAAERLTVGRAAENDIHLPDLAVDPRHAVITAQGTERIAVEAVGSLGFGFDGKTVRSASIDTRTGAELRFGGTRITISRHDSGVPLLTVEPVEEADSHAEADGLALASVMPGKRALSWVLAALVLALFLALPIATNLMRPAEAAPGATAPSHVIGDKAWTPGPLSLAHHQLEGKCEACHVKPFQSVRNETCVSCHKSVHDHASAGRLALARAEPGAGGQLLERVAHAFGKEGPGACMDCHREHEGMTRMDAPNQQFCADCHGTLKDRLKDTKLGNAADFGTLHPQFTAAVQVDPATKTFRRVSLDAAPRENSGLSFPHRLHLDPRGGVARMAASLGPAKGYAANGLGCADCHRPTEDGVRFKPIVMERDCEACHSLVYDRVGPTYRKLRHGDVDQMVADLTVAGRTTAPLVTGRNRPGNFGASQLYFARFTPPAASGGLVQRALGRDGMCGECHAATWRGGKPDVMPVNLPQRYMVNGWFDHAAHKQTQCTACHAAPASTRASDVLLPKVAECRTCHVGGDGSPHGEGLAGLLGGGKQKVPSSCAMCHAFHPTGSASLLSQRARR